MSKSIYVAVICLSVIAPVGLSQELATAGETMPVSEWLTTEKDRCLQVNPFNIFEYLGLKYDNTGRVCSEHSLISRFIPEYADVGYVRGQPDVEFRALFDQTVSVISFDDRLTVVDAGISGEPPSLNHKNSTKRGRYTIIGVDPKL